jgi:hypothetical protein
MYRCIGCCKSTDDQETNNEFRLLPVQKKKKAKPSTRHTHPITTETSSNTMLRQESRSRSFELAGEYNVEGQRRSICTESKAPALLLETAMPSNQELPRGIAIERYSLQERRSSSYRRDSGVDNQRRRRRSSRKDSRIFQGDDGEPDAVIKISKRDKHDIEVKPAGCITAFCWCIHDSLFGKCEVAADGDVFG